MADESVQRKLATILAADVEGYSRLMGIDEAATVATLRAHRAVTDRLIAAHGGRIANSAGDSIIAVFDSAIEAMRTAVAIQTELAPLNAELPDGHQLRFRIGINLGDVVLEGDDVLGDGVNIAARLEGLADAGGICIARNVHDQVADKLHYGYEFLGPQKVKNIERPVRAYRVHFVQRVESGDKMALRPSSAAPPERPSIAVLPFDNMSGDPDQDFIGDGFTEDIITDLSRIRSFLVIARNSTFKFKGAAHDVRRIADELGVRYVVEGSVRRAGDRIRVTAQLIDAPSNNHLWAERYDRMLEDLFLVQDEITESIVARLEPELGRAEYERVKTQPPENLDAWGLYHRGRTLVFQGIDESIEEARKLFRQALDRDPNFAPAYVGLAGSYLIHTEITDDARENVLDWARRGVALDGKDAFARFVLGMSLRQMGDNDAAFNEFETALELNPYHAFSHFGMAGILLHRGRAEEACKHLETVVRLNPPDDPTNGLYFQCMERAHLCLKAYEDAVVWARKSVRYPAPAKWLALVTLTASMGHLGLEAEAEAACEELEKARPGLTIGDLRGHIAAPGAYADHIFDGLRKAGLPEG